MPIVVQKYGGNSVGDTDRIRSVADRIVREREQGRDVVVVVSAMGDTTDDLLDKASDITPVPPCSPPSGRDLAGRLRAHPAAGL